MPMLLDSVYTVLFLDTPLVTTLLYMPLTLVIHLITSLSLYLLCLTLMPSAVYTSILFLPLTSKSHVSVKEVVQVCMYFLYCSAVQKSA